LAAVKIDVRFVSATNSERLDDIRHDLFYRLGVMEIRVPPLRERIEDVPLLATTFVKKYSRKFARGIKRLNVEALEVLMRHHWPGNVRELENIMQRAVVVSPADEIRPSDIKIPGALEAPGAAPGDWALPYEQARRRALLSFQRAYFEALFKRTGANISKAARQADVTRAALYGIMKKTGITPRKRVQQRT
jgi:DNA-binding NtrC family response regulator